MNISSNDASAGACQQMLGSVAAILDKGAAFAGGEFTVDQRSSAFRGCQVCLHRVCPRAIVVVLTL